MYYIILRGELFRHCSLTSGITSGGRRFRLDACGENDLQINASRSIYDNVIKYLKTQYIEYKVLSAVQFCSTNHMKSIIEAYRGDIYLKNISRSISQQENVKKQIFLLQEMFHPTLNDTILFLRHDIELRKPITHWTFDTNRIQFASPVEGYTKRSKNDMIISMPYAQLAYFRKACIVRRVGLGFHSCVDSAYMGPDLLHYKPKYKVTEINSYYRPIPDRHTRFRNCT